MTVLVGLLCDDAVVVGSDSSATFAAGQLPTIEQPTKKVFVIGARIIFAGTGAVGCIQRFEHILSGLLSTPQFLKKSPFDITRAMAKGIIDDLMSTHCPKSQFGAMVAFCSNGTLHLCEFDVQNLQPEFKTRDMWFASMGSGQPITDPFLGMLKRTFFRNGLPKLTEGVFAATWALQQAIELNTGGINGPMQIAVLQKDGAGVGTARLLGEEELQEHQSNVAGIEAHLSGYRDTLAGSGGRQNDPPPPSPPSV